MVRDTLHAVRSRSQTMGAKSSKAKGGGEPPALPEELDKQLTLMFEKMDVDKNGKIDRQEAIKFWGKNFAKVNANAMFNEVDVDKDGELTLNEWKDFWRNVLKHDYKAEDVLEEVNSMLEGGSWVDWNDGRTT